VQSERRRTEHGGILSSLQVSRQLSHEPRQQMHALLENNDQLLLFEETLSERNVFSNRPNS